jgi:PadR family transcriptional regulator, regulatory protein AphA
MPRLDTPVTRLAVLGQLSLRNWSAYELTQSMGRTLHWFWPRAESGIYAEARRLEADGFAISRNEPALDGSRRSRTVYQITEGGRRRLAEWLRTPPTTVQFVIEPFLRLHLARAGTLQDLRESVAAAERAADDLLLTASQVAEEFLAGRHLFQEDLALRGLLLEGLVGQGAALKEWAHATRRELARWTDLEGDHAGRERALEAMRHAVGVREPEPLPDT